MKGRNHVAGRPVHAFNVVRREELTSHMFRVVLGGSGFRTFTPSKFTDSYVKLVFVGDDVDTASLPQPLTLDSFAGLPPATQPVVRTLTVRRADPAAREIAIDVVVHGEHGAAGLWAATAEPGQPVYLMGPSGAYAPDPAADWHLLAGDETALPAIEKLLKDPSPLVRGAAVWALSRLAPNQVVERQRTAHETDAEVCAEWSAARNIREQRTGP